MFSRTAPYLQLTKPTIMALVLFTGATALYIEGSTLARPVDAFLILLGLYLTGGGANALNQCFERDIDARMRRTRERRPLPQGRLSAFQAFAFSIVISLAGVLIFGLFLNWFSALLSLATVLFYSLFYTLWLKPTTPQNIVIGGAAGSMGPVIAWAAASGTLTLTPWILFLIVFFWTPPHFWALALYCKDDYLSIDMPMMPVARGDDSTLFQIVWYSVFLVSASLLMLMVHAGVVYAGAALVAGSLFIFKSVAAKRHKTRDRYIGLFKYSIAYLFFIFAALVIDHIIV